MPKIRVADGAPNNATSLAYELADHVSHAFRTPLSVIMEFASIIGDELAGPVTADQREYLGIIGNCVDDLTLIVSDMLDTGKLEAGLLTVRRARCTVGDVLRRVEPILARKARTRRVALALSLDPDLPDVWADAARVGQVLVNLVTNAVKSAGENGHVNVWAHANAGENEVAVGVTDDGPGLVPEKLQAVLEQFAQVGHHVRAGIKSVGLGLNVANELVAMGLGRMCVESPPGQGSTFSLTVPTANPETIVRRWLRHPELARNGLRQVSLASVRVEDESRSIILAEVDELLHDTLHGSDLIFRLAPQEWALVLDEDAERTKAILARMAPCCDGAEPNRPTVDLPSLRTQHEGTWQPETQRDDLLAALARHGASLEAATFRG